MGNLGEGLTVTVMGLCIVFGVLIILWGVLELFRVLFYKKGKEEATAYDAIDGTDSPVVAPKAVQPEPAAIDEGELVAVITAAIAASLNTSTYHLNIRSLRRVESKAPAWNAVSRKENIENSIQ